MDESGVGSYSGISWWKWRTKAMGLIERNGDGEYLKR